MLFVCCLNCLQGLPGTEENQMEVPLHGCPTAGGCEHLWGTQWAVQRHGPCTADGSWLGQVLKAITKCYPFSMSKAGLESGITCTLSCVGQTLSRSDILELEIVLTPLRAK